MPRAFLSHSWKDKTIVHAVRDALRSSLVDVWIDEEGIGGGDKLERKILPAIAKSQYFIPFFSENYLDSAWCWEELSFAYSQFRKGNAKIFPVLLAARGKLESHPLEEEKKLTLERFFDLGYTEFDPFDLEKNIGKFLDAFWGDQPVRFDPIAQQTIDGVRLQLIRFRLATNSLPTNFLASWGFNIEDFVAADESENDKKPIQYDLPVAFTGAAPNWLVAFLAIPFKNRRTVYMYNNKTNDYTCVYARQGPGTLGTVLKGA